MNVQPILNGITAGLLIGLVALGFNLIYRTARFLHVAHATTYLLGAYTGIYLLKQTQVPLSVAVIGAAGAGAILGSLIEVAIYRPLRKARSSSLVLFLSSLALVVIMQNLITLICGSEIQVVRGGFGGKSLTICGGRITEWQALSAVISIAVYAVVLAGFRLTQIGKKMRAVSSDNVLAAAVGIQEDSIILIAISCGSALAGLAGFAVAYDTSITPNSGFGILLIAITAAIVGGIGSIRGAMVGGLLVGLAQNIGVWKVPVQWQDAIVFAILILFLLLRPHGCFGRPLRAVTV